MTEENNVNPANNPGSVPPPPPVPPTSDQSTQAVPEQPVQPTQSIPEQPVQAPQPASGVVPPPPAQTQPVPPAGQVPPTQQMPPQPQPQSAYPPPPGQVPPQQQPYYGQPPIPPAGAPSNGKAIAALVFGILAILASPSVFFGIVFGIVAIILGVMAVKKPAKDSKATAGKVCGILGIVFSILLLLFYIFIVGWAIDFTDRYSSSSSSSSSGSQSIIESNDDADKQAVVDAAKVAFDSIKNPSAELRAELTADYNDEFESTFGFSMADAGIDPAEVLQVTIDSITYTTPSAYVYSDGTATASSTVDSLDVWSIIYDTTVEIKKQSDAGEIFDITTADGKTKVGNIFKTVMTTTDPLPNYASLDFEKSGGSWKVTDDSLEEEIEYIYGTY